MAFTLKKILLMIGSILVVFIHAGYKSRIKEKKEGFGSNYPGKNIFLSDYYGNGVLEKPETYSSQYLLIPTSKLSNYEQKTNNVKWNERDTPCGGTDKYPHICHTLYGRKQKSGHVNSRVGIF